MNRRSFIATLAASALPFTHRSVLAAPEPAPEPTYKTKYRVINVHRHCALASEAIVQAGIDVCDRVGFQTEVILDAEGPDGNLASWLKLRDAHPGRLAIFWKLDCRRVKDKSFFQDIVRDLDRAQKMGVQGIKVWKDLGMYLREPNGKLLKSDDERFDPFWARCGQHGLPVLIHAADPKEYWFPLTYNSFHYGLRTEKDQHYNNPEMPPWEELIRQRDAILKKHPKTQFIGAHMGSLSFDLKKLGETLEKYPNFSVDCSARLRILGRCNPPAIRDFFGKYQDHVLFGTDNVILSKGHKPGHSKNISVYPSEDPEWQWYDPADKEAVRRWQDRETKSCGEYLQYFETDRVDLTDPSHSGGSWLRIPGVKLPAEVLEKFYHANAERLIPGLKKA